MPVELSKCLEEGEWIGIVEVGVDVEDDVENEVLNKILCTFSGMEPQGQGFEKIS